MRQKVWTNGNRTRIFAQGERASGTQALPSPAKGVFATFHSLTAEPGPLLLPLWSARRHPATEREPARKEIAVNRAAKRLICLAASDIKRALWNYAQEALVYISTKSVLRHEGVMCPFAPLTAYVYLRTDNSNRTLKVPRVPCPPPSTAK